MITEIEKGNLNKICAKCVTLNASSDVLNFKRLNANGINYQIL